MGSDKFYKLWLWDKNAGTPGWIEVKRFMNFAFNHMANDIGRFQATLVIDETDTTEAKIQALLVGTPLFRITPRTDDIGTEITNGLVQLYHFGAATGEAGALLGSREVMTGRLDNVETEEKTENQLITAAPGPKLYNISGASFLENAARAIYDRDTTGFTTTDGVFNDIAATTPISFNAAISDNLTGIGVNFSRDSVLGVATDIASVNGTAAAGSKFPNYIFPSFVYTPATTPYYAPAFVYLTSTSGSSFLQSGAAGIPGYNIDKADLRDFRRAYERKRISNQVKVFYAGQGTGTETTSVTVNDPRAAASKFPEDRQRVTYAQWITSSGFASNLANTQLDMYRGGPNGIVTAEVVPKDPQLFVGSIIAKMGDKFAVKDGATTIIEERILGYSYDQMMQQLTLMLGLPRSFGSQNSRMLTSFNDGSAPGEARTERRQLNSIGRTTQVRQGGNQVLNGSTATFNDLPDGTAVAWNSFIFSSNFDPLVDEGLDVFMAIGPDPSGDKPGNVGDLYEFNLYYDGVPGNLLLARQQFTACESVITIPFSLSGSVAPSIFHLHFSAFALASFGFTGTADRLGVVLVNRSGGIRDVKCELNVVIVPKHEHQV